MGPAQPWHYKMGEATLFCLCHRVCTQLSPQGSLQSPGCGVRTLHTADTPRKIPKGKFWGTLGAPTGSKMRRESSNSNLHCNPKSGRELWMRPYIQYFIWSYRQTTEVATEQHRETEKEIEAPGTASRGHWRVQACKHIPYALPHWWFLLLSNN